MFITFTIMFIMFITFTIMFIMFILFAIMFISSLPTSEGSGPHDTIISFDGYFYYDKVVSSSSASLLKSSISMSTPLTPWYNHLIWYGMVRIYLIHYFHDYAGKKPFKMMMAVRTITTITAIIIVIISIIIYTKILQSTSRVSSLRGPKGSTVSLPSPGRPTWMG